MAKHCAIFLIVALLGFGTPQYAPAAQPLPAYTIHIVIQNRTPNGVWMTAYMRDAGDKIVGSWCVESNKTVDQTFGKGKGPYKVIAEVTQQPNCHGRVFKKLAQDTNWNYCCTTFYVRKTVTGRDSSATW
jgi:hypothetical protein